MVRVPAVPDAARITDWVHEHVAEADLAEDGYENDAHVTVAYGFAPDVTPEEVSQVVRQAAPNGVDLRLGQVSFFSQGYGMWVGDPSAYDVLKVDVESQGLSVLHYALRQAFGERLTITYPDYHPHLTLAYVKKGCCRGLEGNAAFAGWTFHCPAFVYSTPDMANNYVIPMAQPTPELAATVSEPVAPIPDAVAELAVPAVEVEGSVRRLVAMLLEDEEAGEGGFDPEEAEQQQAYQDMQADLRSGECYVIQDARRTLGVDLVYLHKIIGHFESTEEAVKELIRRANEVSFWPSVYYVNERGNVDQLIVNFDEGTYEVGRGWI